MAINQQIFLRRIEQDNPWWEDGTIPNYQDLLQRRYFKEFYGLVSQDNPHRAVVLMGPRRVGKTVMMFQAMTKLIASGVDPKKIIYFSLDTPIFTNVFLEELVNEGLSIHSIDIKDSYIFFDEIQYLKDWEIHLKVLVDSYRETKFTASGSAAAALKMKSRESGAGRFTDFFLPPLTFAEYIDLNAYGIGLLEEVEVNLNGKQKYFKAKNIEVLNQHFIDYINFGGFPELSLNKINRENPTRVIQKDLTDKVIMKDLPGLFGIDNILELQQFFNVIAFRSGEILDYKKVANDTKTDLKTIKKYLTYLESAYLIKILHRVDITAKRFKNVTKFKVYLTNPSLYTGLFGEIKETDERFPHLVETAIFAQFPYEENRYLRYAQWKVGKNEGEVDLLELSRHFQEVNWVTEVKWSDSGKASNLKKFMAKNGLEKGVMTTKSEFKDYSDLLLVPSSVYAYWVGKL